MLCEELKIDLTNVAREKILINEKSLPF